MTILRVEHVTEYEYASRVELAAHMLHLRPRDLPWQTVLHHSLQADPAADQIRWGADHFGNTVAWLFLDHAHGALRVRSEAVVAVEKRVVPRAADTLAWEHVASLAQHPAHGRVVAEFAFGSAMAPAEPEALAYAASSFPPGRPVLAGLLDLMGRIRREFRFDAEVTTVSTPVQRVLQLRAGVCQDFAHLMIAGLRGLGLPARYVSGYVRTLPPPGQARMRGADCSHAWVGCWLGPAQGWIDLDPTNDLVVQDEHVWLGWGRDYADVSPMRGVLLGGGRHSLSVSVDIEPEEERVRAVG
jgi:transglutaminase-like putative cysteine protease